MDCSFSDGTSLHVPNTMKMAMVSGGPKYRHQDGNQEPKKTHPKIVGEAGADPEWVECKIN